MQIAILHGPRDLRIEEQPLDFNPLSMELFYNKEISLISVSHHAGDSYPADDRDRFGHKTAIAYVLDLMADGTLKPVQLVTHRDARSRKWQPLTR